VVTGKAMYDRNFGARSLGHLGRRRAGSYLEGVRSEDCHTFPSVLHAVSPRRTEKTPRHELRTSTHSYTSSRSRVWNPKLESQLEFSMNTRCGEMECRYRLVVHEIHGGGLGNCAQISKRNGHGEPCSSLLQ